jgi:hypothetical protein
MRVILRKCSMPSDASADRVPPHLRPGAGSS